MKKYNSKLLSYSIADNKNSSSNVLDKLVEEAAEDETLRHKLLVHPNISANALYSLKERDEAK